MNLQLQPKRLIASLPNDQGCDRAPLQLDADGRPIQPALDFGAT